ncbi:MAG TPA: rhomboid family intramembrane serine protease [Candidatus Nitrosopolaris sp.]|nr:rhomboid family intramembrane serine protease [Candidatus Nitrosopolaris sp.]
MFPIHDDAESVHGRPYVNYSLIAINAAVFTWEILVTGFFSNGRTTSEIFLEYGAIPKFVLAGDIPIVVTSMFIHGGIIHLAGNMVFLYVFGDNVEDRFGHIKYLAFYILWGLLATLVHSIYAVVVGGGEVPAIGASGAISGVLGAYLIMFPRAKIYTIIIVFFITTIRIPALAFIPFWFILQILFALIGQSGGVAYLAHIGGFLAGVGTGYIWKYLAGDKVIPSINKTRKMRPKIEDVSPSLEPEVIEGADFYEIIAEIHGISSVTDIHADYEPDYKRVRIVASGSRKYELFAKLPDSANNPIVAYVHYLNGIARIHLTK